MLTEQQLPTTAQQGPLSGTLDLSVIIVSFNTLTVLRECLQRLQPALAGIPAEVIVVDNASADGSADMVEREFPDVRLVRSPENVGFAAANNIAIPLASGRFILLLNSDAFVDPETIRLALTKMQSDPKIGVGGARLIGPDGSWRPSARMFPSVLNHFLMISGLSWKYAKSRFCGRADRTWADPMLPADVDWVPGCFMIIPKEAIDKTGVFDETFFFYYEEIDLCRRIKRAGYRVRYFPDVVVIHLEGASSGSNQPGAAPPRPEARLRRLRWSYYSQFLYFRKHHGAGARLTMWIERGWHQLRAALNTLRGPAAKEKVNESRSLVEVMDRSWRETEGGRVAPARPWKV